MLLHNESNSFFSSAVEIIYLLASYFDIHLKHLTHFFFPFPPVVFLTVGLVVFVCLFFFFSELVWSGMN